MNWFEEAAAVIPCLNEERTIGGLVREARRYFRRVYVVNDGSTDRTGAVAGEAGAVVLTHRESQGKGRSLEAGFAQAYADGAKWVLCLDGDGQHDPADIPPFLKAAESLPAAMVVGNRMEDAATMPWLRRFVNRWMSARLTRLAGIDLPDSQCGFRLVELEPWSRMSFNAPRFEIESEMLLRFIGAHQRIAFVSIATVYGQEQSKIRPWRDSIRWFKWYFQARKEMKKIAIRPELAHDLSN